MKLSGEPDSNIIEETGDIMLKLGSHVSMSGKATPMISMRILHEKPFLSL